MAEGWSVDRPVIHVLIAMPGTVRATEPMAFFVINLLDWEDWKAHGYVFIGVDPADEAAFRAWVDEQEDCA